VGRKDLPTVRVDLLDSKITLSQKRQLAESLTDVVSETLGYPKDRVFIIFRRTPKSDIARGGKLGR
jgi:phenylpyruvate tautomerase PptA (4-oxalocrotonate tautomerase family)